MQLEENKATCFVDVMKDLNGLVFKCFIGFVNSLIDPCIVEAFAIGRLFLGCGVRFLCYYFFFDLPKIRCS